MQTVQDLTDKNPRRRRLYGVAAILGASAWLLFWTFHTIAHGPKNPAPIDGTFLDRTALDWARTMMLVARRARHCWTWGAWPDICCWRRSVSRSRRAGSRSGTRCCRSGPPNRAYRPAQIESCKRKASIGGWTPFCFSFRVRSSDKAGEDGDEGVLVERLGDVALETRRESFFAVGPARKSRQGDRRDLAAFVFR